MIKRLLTLGILLAFFVQCVNNVSDTGDTDLIEFESVWQYLKAYSIYQDECSDTSGTGCKKRLSDDPFVYSSPSAMMDSMYDTLRGNKYTKYYGGSGAGSAAGIAVSQSVTAVSFYKLTDLTAMIRISEFITDVTFGQFLLEIKKLSGTFKNCIVDLRGNPGGDLEELDSIIGMFLPANSPYILARERKYDPLSGQFTTVDFRPLTTTRGASPFLTGKKYLVLMDRGSASAAEILVAALKDCRGATIAGECSYGKAMGQIRLHRRGRLGLQITFLQLKGISFGAYQNIGIKPDSIISVNPVLSPTLQQREYLFKAVRMLEPSVAATVITYPSGLVKAVLTKETASGYKNVFEE